MLCVYAGGFGKIDLIKYGDREYVGKSQNIERDDMREMVDKEIQILKQLKGHQNIVQIINHAHVSPQEMYIVLEYCEGMTCCLRHLQYLILDVLTFRILIIRDHTVRASIRLSLIHI